MSRNITACWRSWVKYITFSKSRCILPKPKLWNLSGPEVRLQFGNYVHESAQSFQNPQHSDRTWKEIKTCLRNASDTACGWTCGGKIRRIETWWWNDVVDCAIKEKRRLWKDWQEGGDKEQYLQAKRKAKSAIYATRKSAQEAKFGDFKSNDKKNQIFKEARMMKSENQDIVGDRWQIFGFGWQIKISCLEKSLRKASSCWFSLGQ